VDKHVPTTEEIAEENRKLRLLRLMVDLTISLMYQTNLTREEALDHFEKVRGFALRLFPEKELAFELIYAPRFKRAIGDIHGCH